MAASEFAGKLLRRLAFFIPLLALSLSCIGAKSATITLSYKIRVPTAQCAVELGGPCTTPFVPFLENFTVTIDPSVPIGNPTAAGLDIISINRPYSSLFTYMPFAEVGGEDALLFVGTYGENGCFISDSTYCLFIQVKQPLASIGFTETTATGEVWEGQMLFPKHRRG
jgi:hypothetical protein